MSQRLALVTKAQKNPAALTRCGIRTAGELHMSTWEGSSALILTLLPCIGPTMHGMDLCMDRLSLTFNNSTHRFRHAVAIH